MLPTKRQRLPELDEDDEEVIVVGNLNKAEKTVRGSKKQIEEKDITP